MVNKSALLNVIFLLCLFFSSQNVYSYSLCFKEGVFLKDVVVASSADINEHFKICPWCKQNKVKFIRLFLFEIHEERVDYMTSILSYMLGESLRRSNLSENKILGQQYIQYSFDLAYKHGLTTEEHLKTLAGIYSK